MHCHCDTNNRAPRWTYIDPCKPEVRPGAREESVSPAWLATPAMNARDTTMGIYGGLTLDVDRQYIGSVANRVNSFFIYVTSIHIALLHISDDVFLMKHQLSFWHLVLANFGLAYVFMVRPISPELVMFPDFEFKYDRSTGTALQWYMIAGTTPKPHLRSHAFCHII